MENTELPRIEVQAAKTDPRVEELEDQIADLIAQMLYAHILRKGLLKKRKNVLDATSGSSYDGMYADKSLLEGG